MFVGRALHRLGAGDGRDAAEGVRHARRGPSGRAPAVRGHDVQAGGGGSAVRRRQGGAGGAIGAGARRGGARRRCLRRYAGLVESLRGTYVTAADMNTNQTDMDVIGERTSHVLGRSRERGGSGDPAPGTAVGVFHGIAASARLAFGSEDLGGRKVLVQGVGSVGARLIELLRDAGASLLVVGHRRGARARGGGRRRRRPGGARRRDRDGMRRVRAVRDRRGAQRDDDPATGGCRWSRAPRTTNSSLRRTRTGSRTPGALRARLRDQCRRRDPPGRVRADGMGGGGRRCASRRDRRDVDGCVRARAARRSITTAEAADRLAREPTRRQAIARRTASPGPRIPMPASVRPRARR